MDALLFKSAYALYTASTLLYLFYFFRKKESLSHIAFALLIGALALHFGSLVARMETARAGYLAQAAFLRAHGQAEAALAAVRAAHGYMPWNNWFESFSFFGAIVALVYGVIAWRTPIPILGSFVMALSWALLTGSLIKAEPLRPALPTSTNSWLAVHIPIMFTSYSLLAVAFAVAIAYLIEERDLKTKRPRPLSFRLPPLEDLDRMIFKLIVAAFPLLTLGIFLGGLWAQEAWGRFWSWDAKETWALITWFVYLVYFHLRFVAGWRGRKTAYVSLVGFAAVMFTYVGVNYLSPLHGFLSHP